jgi:hypothetical protein
MEGDTKLHEWSQQPFVHKFLIVSTWDFWKSNGPVGLMTKLCSERLQDLNSGKGECFLSLQDIRTASGETQPPGYYVLAFLTRETEAETWA